jgi:hypothetical protein
MRPARAPALLLAAALPLGAAPAALPPGGGDAPAAVAFTWLLPSASHWPGSGKAFYLTDLTVVNRDAVPTTVTLKFLGHDQDGTTGPESSWVAGAGETLTFHDVLASVFGFSAAWGGILVTAGTPLLDVSGRTSTAAPGGGTFGQSVPGVPADSLLRPRFPAQIAGIREDSGFRTNLVLANATEGQVVVHGELYDGGGERVGSGFDWILPPLGMVQANRVVETFTPSPMTDGKIVLSTATSGGAVAAYASVIDNVTNDPRTLLPATEPEPQKLWIVPSGAHAPGTGGAFYTTTLLVTNTGTGPATVAIQFLGHDQDGTSAPTRLFGAIDPLTTLALNDVLGSEFGVVSGYGAIRVSSDSATLAVSSQTSTPSPGGGSYGQSVPGVPASRMARQGTSLAIAGLREDAGFRTNLVLANAASVPVVVHGDLYAPDGTKIASGDWPVPPLTMTQVNRVVKQLLGSSASIADGVLALTTPTAGGAFTAYASVIDAVTNDPLTLLPR